MKTARHIGFIIRTSFLLSLVLLVPAIFADDAVPAAKVEEPKTHAVFMGTDISIEHGKKLYRLQDVSGTSFIISVDGEKTEIPMRGERHNMKVEQSLKLTNILAAVNGLTAERAYTPRSDPKMRRMIESSQAMDVIGDNASLAMGKYVAAQNKGYVGINSDAKVAGVELSVKTLNDFSAAAAKNAFSAQQMADAQMDSDLARGASSEVRAESDLLEGKFDAIEVNFEVASENVTLTTPYVILVVRYHQANKPDTARDLIYARALDSIGRNPQKIHILQGGFPAGYELENYQIHLYNLGQEVATNVAPKRVALTRNDAFEYVKAEYLSTHKNATVPAAPALGKLGIESKATLTAAQLKGVYYVKVTKEGRPVEAYGDEACSQPVDTLIDSLAKSVLFYPALENGKRVEGVARLVFSQLTR